MLQLGSYNTCTNTVRSSVGWLFTSTRNALSYVSVSLKLGLFRGTLGHSPGHTVYLHKNFQHVWDKKLIVNQSFIPYKILFIHSIDILKFLSCVPSPVLMELGTQTRPR